MKKVIYVEKFLEIEEKLALFDLNFDGIFIWPHVRYYTFLKILDRKNLTSNTLEGEINKSLSGYFKKIIHMVKNILQKREIWFNTKKDDIDFLIFNFPRKKIINKYYVDIFTNHIIQEFKKLVLIEQISDKQYPSLSITKFLNVIIAIGLIRSFFILPKFNKHERKHIYHIQKQFYKSFKVNIDFFELFSQKLKFIKGLTPILTRLLLSFRPNIVIQVMHNVSLNLLINEIAQKFDIKTIEIQHGTLSPSQIMYRFPEGIIPKTMAEYFFCFGAYWKNVIPLPFASKKILPVGSPYFESEYYKFKKIENEDEILFISSPAIGKKIFRFAIKVANLIGKTKVIYKLHPKEYHIWKAKYGVKFPSNLKIINNDKIPLYKMIAKAMCVVGVNSTVLIESLMFEKLIFIIKISNWDYYNDFLKKGYMVLIEEPEELIEKIKSKRHNKKVKVEYFFNLNSKHNQINVLKKLIKKSNL